MCTKLVTLFMENLLVRKGGMGPEEGYTRAADMCSPEGLWKRKVKEVDVINHKSS